MLYTGGLKLIGKGVTFSLECHQGRVIQVWMHPRDLMYADLPQLGNPAFDDQRLLEKPTLTAKWPKDTFPPRAGFRILLYSPGRSYTSHE